VVTFEGGERLHLEPPILLGPQQNVGGAHLLSPDVATAIPALWYCLHLPRDAFDVVDLPARVLKFLGEVGNPLQVLFLPMAWLSEEAIAASPFASCDRMRIYCSDSDLELGLRRTSDLGFRFPPVEHSALDDAQLQHDWDSLREYWSGLTVLSDADIRGDRLELRPLASDQVMAVAMARAARQMGRAVPVGESMDVRSALTLCALVNATGRLEQLHTSPEVAEGVLQEEVVRAYHTSRVPVSAVLPGVPRAFLKTLSRSVRSKGASTHVSESATPAIEREAMAVVAAGTGVQNEAPSLLLPEVPPPAWVALADLERHWIGPARPPVVEMMLRRLNQIAAPVWNDQLLEVLGHASLLRIATNFPLGLLTMPGDSAPLSFRLPIAYEPLIPLTRRLQRTFMPLPEVDLSEGFHTLVVECIPESDPVGQLSRQGWDVAEEMFEQARGVPASISRRDANNVIELRDALNEARPDIAVISAHGFSRLDSNSAGIVVGHEPFIGLGLDYVPPVVLLSACHVSPRGVGQVSVVDLLLQQGVRAVLGTQVPVDVRHNAVLMVRLFVYIRESLAGAEPESSLLAAWHRTISGNPINHILQGNDRLAEWAHSPIRDGVVLTDFMLNSSVGRLRKPHIYADTERVLTQIADEEGLGEQVSKWLRTPGYLPESAMYSFYGRPDQIRLAPPPVL
jgi:hypothetical protein